MKSKVLRVYEDDNQLFVITYRTCDKNHIVREDVRVFHPTHKETRYYGKTPIIFVNERDIENLETLNLANMIRIALETNLHIKNDTTLILALKNALNGKRISFSKEIYTGELSQPMLLRPSKEFVAFSNSMITRVGKKIVESQGGEFCENR